MSLPLCREKILEVADRFDAAKVSKVFPGLDACVSRLEAIQGHTYANRNVARVALIHRSALVHWPQDKAGVLSNERLEFWGDAVLCFFCASMAMTRFPEWQEGELSKIRAAIVGAQNLARKSRALGIDALLQFGRGEARQSGASSHENIHADAFEAVTAALLADAGFEIAWSWLCKVFEDDFSNGEEILNRFDAKSRFQQWLQGILGVPPVYRVIGSDSTPERTEFIVAAFIGSQEIARASAPNKRVASKMAAERLLDMVERGQLTAEMVKRYSEESNR